MSNDETKALWDVFSEMSPANRAKLLAIARTTYASQKITQKAVCEELGFPPGTVPAYTPGVEGLPGAGIRV